MTREIKFRAWNGEEMFENVQNIEFGAFLGGDYEVMQFTGLKDKNGKEIYEGDLVKSGNGRIWMVEFGDWTYTELRQESDQYGFFLRGEDDNTIAVTGAPYGEIIGNIYENPELLHTTEGKSDEK